jgi:RND family efflux transporter MFP subunit
MCDTMKPWLKWILAALVLALVVAGALRALSARTAQKEALALQQEAQRVPAQIELSAGDLVPVRMADLPRVLAISGPVKAVNSAFVKARVAGELQDLKVREGDYVKVGEVIAKVDTTEYQARTRQAQQQAQAAKAQVDIAQRNFDNNQALVSKGFISSTALESSAATLAAAQASFSAAQAGADVALKALDDTVLRAPIAGVVSQRLVQPGERVAVDARVVEIVDLARLEVEASLSAADSFLVKVGQTARLTVEGSDKPVVAKVARINPSAVAGSRAVLIYLAIDSSTGLRQGFFAQGTLQTDVLRTLAVPLGAVRTDKPVPYVQLLIQGKVVHQEVTLGQRGEIDGVGWVAIQGVPENTTALAGTVGSLRNDTPVKLANGAK